MMMQPLNRTIRLSLIMAAALFFDYAVSSHAADLSKPVASMVIKDLASVDEVQAAVEKIKIVVESTDIDNPSSFDTQKAAINKLGECISKLASFTGRKTAKKEKRKAYAAIRDTLKHISAENEKTILFFQENKLDDMENPSEFFKSSQWQNPQYLISLAGYWLGWNGYYSWLQLQEEDIVQNELLEEAIKGFSRSFIDFQEEEVILRSLLGRALCQSRLKSYDNAKKDLSAVKKRLDKNHPLYLRCLYEECRILYVTGNSDMALRRIDEIYEDYAKKEIPAELDAGFDQLKGKILVGFSETPEHKNREITEAIDPDNDKIFSGLKKLAEKPGGIHEFYKYCRESAGRMKHLSYADLGPVGALGIGDLYFERKEYDASLNYYLPIISGSPKILDGKMDMVRFRIGTIYCLNKNWQEAISSLKDFHKQYPDSYLLEHAVPLYYSAASNNYRQKADQQAYRQFIDAVRVYATRCRGKCPELSEAHFQLGRDYESAGKTEEAIKEFLLVNADSPNFAIAKYYLLKHYVGRLEDLKNTGQIPSIESDRLFQESLDTVKSYQDVSSKKKQTASMKRIHPHMMLLQADLLTFDLNDRYPEILAKINGFEKKYPGERRLFPKVFQLRASCYSELGRNDQLNSEIDRFVSANPIDKSRYDAIRDLANDFYYRAGISRDQYLADDSKKYAMAAVTVYRALYRLSLGHSGFIHNCDAIQLRMAQLYIDMDQSDEAEALYREILKRNSLSADAYYSLGLLYENKEQWEDALEIWRKFSAGVKDGTYHWYESRYKTAWTHVKLGHVKEACEILAITMVLHPDLGSEELAVKYQRLRTEVCKENP